MYTVVVVVVVFFDVCHSPQLSDWMRADADGIGSRLGFWLNSKFCRLSLWWWLHATAYVMPIKMAHIQQLSVFSTPQDLSCALIVKSLNCESLRWVFLWLLFFFILLTMQLYSLFFSFSPSLNFVFDCNFSSEIKLLKLAIKTKRLLWVLFLFICWDYKSHTEMIDIELLSRHFLKG